MGRTRVTQASPSQRGPEESGVSSPRLRAASNPTAVAAARSLGFHFSTFNHCDDGRRCIEDLTRILSAQLRALGHEVTATVDGSFSWDGYNVLYESFADPGTIDRIAAARAEGCRFLYIATEEPTEAGCFGGRLDNAMRERQEAFVEAARYADGILHLIPGERVNAWYSRCAPAAYVELGYAEDLVHHGPAIEPDLMFGFYGQMTPRRREIFDRLSLVTGERVEVLPFIKYDAAARDVMMRRCMVVLQVRAHDSMETVSSSRCATALNLGRPVVAEPHTQRAPWDRIVHFSASANDFYEDAVTVASAWDSTYIEQIGRFAAILPPEVCLGEPLRRIGAK